MTIVGVSHVGWIQAGPWAGRKVIGCSLAIGVGGEILGVGPYGHDAEAMMTIEIDPRPPIGWGSGFSDAMRQRNRSESCSR